jgi:hypothetical protein
MCFGRWDTHNHPLADVHPTDWSRTLFPGQDYNNARVIDFQHVDNYVSNAISIMETPRMPWHDVSYEMFVLPRYVLIAVLGSYDNVWFYLLGSCPAFRREMERDQAQEGGCS